jgi:hypothetical protein
LTISSVKRIISLIILSLIFSLCSLNFSNFAFAAGHQELYIHGESSQGGPIFHQAGSLGVLWAPGVEDSGTITIHNNYSQRIRVSNIGLTMDLQKQKGEVISNPELLESFAQNMELIIKKKVAGIFNDTIYRGTFWELLYQRDNPAKQGFNLPRLDKFNLGKGSSIELQYRVKMKESAGNQLQGIKATVSFLINASENQEIVGDDNSGDYEVNDYEGHWAQDCISTLLKQDILKPNAEGFVSGDNWQPGSSVTEDLVVSNDGTLDLKYRISAAMADGANAALYNELMVIISKGGQELYNGLLKDMTPILPGTIAVGGSDTLTFTVSLPDSGAPQNHLQGLNAGVIFTFDATQTNNADDAWVYQQ